MKPPRLHPALLLFALAIHGSLLAATATDSGILGFWRPVELDSGAFKQVQFVDEDGKVKMHIWSSINGGEMDPHAIVATTDIPSSEAAKATSGTEPFVIHRKASFKNSTYTVSLSEKSLRIHYHNEYTDDSGRGIREMDLYFVRGLYEDAVAASKDTELTESGWLGIWKNRDESTRGVAQLTIRDLRPVTMSTWGIMSGGISPRPGTTVALPISGYEAGKKDAEGSLEATTDLGWAKITYKMKLHPDGLTVTTETDYTDPNRRDQEFEYEFVRGAWKE
ncbi:MAG: hypothetical protein P1U81_16960 [Verrucomicrobiales bacterium]|nr:hypothetical protein [Verrucomicrobiales bacterium]